VADLPLFLDVQNLVEVDAGNGREGRAFVGRIDGETRVVGGQVNLAMPTVPSASLRRIQNSPKGARIAGHIVRYPRPRPRGLPIKAVRAILQKQLQPRVLRGRGGTCP
jgi:hypothetical protein